jgi:fumarylacetoacetate (FAA) hydrolase family protein
LAPIDLQNIKAAGVTFVASMLERVIEEKAKGDSSKAEEIRKSLLLAIGTQIGSVKPGSEQATKLKNWLVEQKLWSQCILYI